MIVVSDGASFKAWGGRSGIIGKSKSILHRARFAKFPTLQWAICIQDSIESVFRRVTPDPIDTILDSLTQQPARDISTPVAPMDLCALRPISWNRMVEFFE